MSQCLGCGGLTKTRREKHYRYAESGLPNVVIEDAVKVTVCERCGETYTSIPDIEELHRQIVAAVIRKKGRLAPAEIRFLRKWLGWSGVDFARRTGTKPETVSRWENGKASMSPQADRLVRLLVAKETPVMEYPVDVLAQVAADDGPSTPVRIELEKGPRGWKFRRGPALVTAS
jgi:putative zinc finger/helix-turn-helix YgiT family protein